MHDRVLLGSWALPHARPVLHLTGRMLVALSAAMLLPAAADGLAGNPDWRAFLLGSPITFACGAGLVYATRCRLTGGLTVRQAFLLTPLAWTTLVLFGALPLYISDYAQLKDSFTNAFFESMSGLTTTGATVIVGLDTAPPGILLWRALLQWLGASASSGWPSPFCPLWVWVACSSSAPSRRTAPRRRCRVCARSRPPSS